MSPQSSPDLATDAPTAAASRLALAGAFAAEPGPAPASPPSDDVAALARRAAEAATAEAQLELAIGDAGSAAAARLTRGYRAEADVYDELVDADGRIRPHWLPLLSGMAGLGEAGLAARFGAADRYLRESGVVYRVYGEEDGERPWPLTHMPLVLDAADWRTLAEGIVQRAELFEALLADLYGEARLVTEGVVPAALVAGSPEFLRPLVGAKPPGGRYLQIYAADVSRAPDGRWWVLADRTQAPSGAGYVIQNRIAVSRGLRDLYEAMDVARMTGFFQALRAGLGRLTGREDPRVALLTPGPWNETYFEHAYLARSLGFLLVEGGDLAVAGDHIALRTIEGPEPVDAILRRIDADFADPLELNGASHLGVPGLVEAVRKGRIVVANALGTGLVEAPGFVGYLPALARRLLGEDLKLPNVASWWCGEPVAREAVLADLAGKAIVPAFGRSLPGMLDSTGVDGRSLNAAERARLADRIMSRGVDFVGQEPIRLATTPVMEQGRLVPRPYALRVFAAHGPDGWHVMAGGLCRISARRDARALSMQRGGRSADVWVLGRAGLGAAAIRSDVALVPDPEHIEIRRQTGPLPSRAADNLFWFGRYLERAEATLRLVRGLEGTSDDGALEPRAALREDIAEVLALCGATPFGIADARRAAALAIAGRSGSSLPTLVSAARRNAATLRDRLSPDAWRALVQLARRVSAATPERIVDDVFEIAETELRAVSSIVGLGHETMNRVEGWRFLDLGWRIERAIAVTRLARRFGAGSPEALDLLLELVDARISYRARYIAGIARRPVLDLVLLDAAHPRSVAFQVERVVDHLEHLASRREGSPRDTAARLARKLAVELESAEPGAFDADRLGVVERALMEISDAVTARYFGPPAAPEDEA